MMLMDTKVLVYLMVGMAAIIGVVVVLLYNHIGPTAPINAPITSTPPSNQITSPQSNSTTLFSSTPYYQYAYVVSDPTLSQQSRSALAGFNLTNTQLANGTRKITITFQGSGQSQVVMLQPNYTLYVIEATFGDDSYSFDSSLGDDGFVVVNPSGYVV